MSTGKTERVKLPGHGSDVRFYGDKAIMFSNALYYGNLDMPLTTLREISMMNLMNSLTDKPYWDVKVFDPTIISRWKTETFNTPGADFSQPTFDWCIAELQYKAQRLKDTNAVVVFNGDIVKSDSAVPDDLRLSLINAVKSLEDVPKILDLVHPSLFPLVYGHSRILPHDTTSLEDCISRCGEGETIPVTREHYIRDMYEYDPFSLKFQWLPCEVDISTGNPRITSYINNLHPQQHSKLYGLIERLISFAIPLWNLTLTPQRADPRTSKLKAGKYVDLQEAFRKTGLQIIVKLANIVLTPEKPEYEGGTWHVEGQLNEHICASALYYYGSENITPSRLAFRHVVQPEKYGRMAIQYEQYDHGWLHAIFGCEHEKPGIQEVGSIETRQGRLITFPNIFQHQVQPFKLADSTKPGHRKIVALFLVDPTIKIISTANIPCQRKDWWQQEVCQDQTGLSKIPVELQDLIFDQVEDFPLSMDEAKEFRIELMAERSKFKVAQHDMMFAWDQFSLCEH